jgi:hypothetical protein
MSRSCLGDSIDLVRGKPAFRIHNLFQLRLAPGGKGVLGVSATVPLVARPAFFSGRSGSACI